MPAFERSFVIATRGSALALAQSSLILAQCRAAFPRNQFEIKVIKTTGDKLQTMALTNANHAVTKGLFTKELEVALLKHTADLAVHSLKDLPTELPPGLKLGAVTKRADVRDLLIYRNADFLAAQRADAGAKRGLPPQATIQEFPSGATIATSSTRRQAQLLALRADLKLVPIRGNVGTRLQKLADQSELDGLVLAAAGFERLGFQILASGEIHGKDIPAGLLAVYLSPEEMLPCVGQAALGIEMRIDDPNTDAICATLNDYPTQQCVTAERAFLHGMGGGCLSPVAAYADIHEGQLRLRAVSFREERVRRGEKRGAIQDADQLGTELARELRE